MDFAVQHITEERRRLCHLSQASLAMLRVLSHEDGAFPLFSVYPSYTFLCPPHAQVFFDLAQVDVAPRDEVTVLKQQVDQARALANSPDALPHNAVRPDACFFSDAHKTSGP